MLTSFPRGFSGGAVWDPASVLEGVDGSVVYVGAAEDLDRENTFCSHGKKSRGRVLTELKETFVLKKSELRTKHNSSTASIWGPVIKPQELLLALHMLLK